MLTTWRRVKFSKNLRSPKFLKFSNLLKFFSKKNFSMNLECSSPTT